MILQSPAQTLPWWDSQLFGSAIISLILAFTSWLTGRKLNGIKLVADKTHILVNSQMGEQLRTNVTSAQALYVAVKTPESYQLLLDAQKALADHNIKQALVDKGE
jgi:hypothetical protein